MENFNFINQLPGLVLVKDLNSIVLNVSPVLAKMVGWKASEFIGTKDHDIPCKAAEFADKFVSLDKRTIITRTKMLTLDIQYYHEGWATLLVERTPLYDSTNNCIGIISQAIDITKTHLAKNFSSINLSDNKIINSYDKPAIYMLSEEHSPISLPKRQQECLFLLVRGKAIKDIANILGLSTRTIEEHIEAIKAKFNCRTKKQVIEQAIYLGFLYYIPERFLNK